MAPIILTSLQLQHVKVGRTNELIAAFVLALLA
jgi:hypothetical protein